MEEGAYNIAIIHRCPPGGGEGTGIFGARVNVNESWLPSCFCQYRRTFLNCAKHSLARTVTARCKLQLQRLPTEFRFRGV